MYHTHQTSTNILKYSSFPRSIQEWNDLPSHVVNSYYFSDLNPASYPAPVCVPIPNPDSQPNPFPKP